MKQSDRNKIHIIHNPNATDAAVRLDRIKYEMDRQKVDYSIWNCVEDKHSVVRSINLSHKRIVDWAKVLGWDSVTIAEDDCVFPAEDALMQWNLFEPPPGSVDIYLGGNYTFEGFRDIAYVCRGIKCHHITGFHFYRVYRRFFDTFLSIPDDEHIDTSMSGKGFFWCKYPMIAIQAKGWSTNLGQEVDYNTLLRDEDIYRG